MTTMYGPGIPKANNHPNVHPIERIASGVAGAALATYAAVKKRDLSGIPMALAGGLLLYRGISGNCMGYTLLRTGTAPMEGNDAVVIPHGQGVKVLKSVTIAKPASELFAFWRKLENLPKFFSHLESVTEQYHNHSHWVAKGPFDKKVAWDAEIINEIPNQLIAWKSVEHADVPNAGSVTFKELPHGEGTEVTVNLEYNPPAGLLGAAVAKLWHEEPNQQVEDDLQHFKQLMESEVTAS